MTWQTSNYPADTRICPHCGKDVKSAFDTHEVLVHPDKRNYPQQYIEWRNQQNAELLKKKKKKS